MATAAFARLVVAGVLTVVFLGVDSLTASNFSFPAEPRVARAGVVDTDVISTSASTRLRY